MNEKYPALKYEKNAILATRMLISNAVVDISFGANAKRESTARYPEAPPCPTEEYRNATMKNKPQIKRTSAKESSMLFPYKLNVDFPSARAVVEIDEDDLLPCS